MRTVNCILSTLDSTEMFRLFHWHETKAIYSRSQVHNKKLPASNVQKCQNIASNEKSFLLGLYNDILIRELLFLKLAMIMMQP